MQQGQGLGLAAPLECLSELGLRRAWLGAATQP